MFFSYFTDAILRGPTIGSMLMCLSAALIGTVIFLRKQSLIGEALSHASYPGVILGIIAAAFFSIQDSQDSVLALMIAAAAFFTAIAGMWFIHYLESKCKIKSDAALCLTLSLFFGIGITLASEIQFSLTSLYRQSLAYLYGQAATMTDNDIIIYGLLALSTLLIIFLFYKEIQVMTFNIDFAKSIGMKVNRVDAILFVLTAISIVVGIRSVGVVLMSAMLIAPPAAARQYTHHLRTMFLLSGFFAVISGFLGNYLSVELSHQFSLQGARFIFPTGPMIVLVASTICFISLLFAPKRGLLLRIIRIGKFRHKCLQENILKAIWRLEPNHQATLQQISKYQNISTFYLRLLLSKLIRKKYLQKQGETFQLTEKGKKYAAHVVRLHRLWEVYLVDYLGVGSEKVHRNAEEIEHIITPELEKELTLLLKDPKMDPHHQKIPPHEESVSHELL